MYSFEIITYNYYNEILASVPHTIIAGSYKEAKAIALGMCQSAWSWYQQVAYFKKEVE